MKIAKGFLTISCLIYIISLNFLCCKFLANEIIKNQSLKDEERVIKSLEIDLLFKTIRIANIYSYKNDLIKSDYKDFKIVGTETSKALVIFQKRMPRNAITISFKGTDSLVNGLQDAKVTGKQISKGNVHSGFYDYYNLIKDELQSAVFKYMTYDDKTKIGGQVGYIIFTGHSLGAAVATLAYSQMKEIIDNRFKINTFKKYILITYGSPQVGNGTFVNDVNQSDLLYNIRFVHGNDLVTKQPNLPGYAHVGTEIKVPSNNIKQIEEPICTITKPETLSSLDSNKDYSQSVQNFGFINVCSILAKWGPPSARDWWQTSSIRDHTTYETSVISDFYYFKEVINLSIKSKKRRAMSRKLKK